jgi:signal transduction histidine kinase
MARAFARLMVVRMLSEFISSNREQILAEARALVVARSTPTQTELTEGLPLFLDQLGDALRRASLHEVEDHDRIKVSADRHGQALFDDGLTVGQVVHDYGDLCQVITGLAVSRATLIDAGEFQVLNLCLDDAIAGAVTAFGARRERETTDAGTERLGVLAHEMRNVLNTAMLAFGSIKRGAVAPGGSTSVMLERSLVRLNTLIDRSLADVRLDVGIENLERIPVREILAEVEIGAAVVAHSMGLHLRVHTVDADVIVASDRQILAAAVANLLQNALKFTRAGSTVTVRATATEHRVLIEVADECGGLPPERQENLLLPFVQKNGDRSGLGLGLSICAKAMKSVDGALRIRDLPGEGCVFTLDLPRQPAPPPSIAGAREAKQA